MIIKGVMQALGKKVIIFPPDLIFQVSLMASNIFKKMPTLPRLNLVTKTAKLSPHTSIKLDFYFQVLTHVPQEQLIVGMMTVGTIQI